MMRRYLCFTDVKTYMEALAYLGFCLQANPENPQTPVQDSVFGQLEDAMTSETLLWLFPLDESIADGDVLAPSVSRSRRDERAAGSSSRSLFVCRIVGRQAVGKVRPAVYLLQHARASLLTLFGIYC